MEGSPPLVGGRKKKRGFPPSNGLGGWQTKTKRREKETHFFQGKRGGEKESFFQERLGWSKWEEEEGGRTLLQKIRKKLFLLKSGIEGLLPGGGGKKGEGNHLVSLRQVRKDGRKKWEGAPTSSKKKGITTRKEEEFYPTGRGKLIKIPK